MDIAKTTELIKAIATLLAALSWPVLAFFLAIYFGTPFKKFLSNIGEFSGKFGPSGIEVTAKAEAAKIEAAAALGAAAAKAETGENQAPAIDESRVRTITSVIAEVNQPRTIRKLSEAVILWVDDNPSYTVYERRALEAFGIEFVLSATTEDALTKIRPGKYAVIISDMGRPPDTMAGFTLLEALKKQAETTPFIIYAGTRAVELRDEAQKRGAFASTNNPEELFQLVLKAIQG